MIYQKNLRATITINNEALQKMVDEKVKEIEFDIQGIRNKAIDDFAEKVKEIYPFTILELEELDKVAEQLKEGGVE